MEEMIDVLDENGMLTGKVLSRKEIHRGGTGIGQLLF